MNVTHITPFQVHLIGIACLGLIGAGGYFVAIEPALDERTAFMRRSAEYSDTDREVVVMEANVRVDRRTLDERTSRLDQMDIKLETLAYANDRMVRVSRLAERFGLSVQSLQPGQPEVQGRHTLVPLRLAGLCSYTAMVDFIHAMRKEFPDTRVNALQVSAASDPGVSSFSLDCTWFAAQPQAATAPAAAAAGTAPAGSAAP